MPRSSSEPPPIRDYSQPWPEWALSKQSLTPTEHKILQLHFDRRAFADRVSIEDGAPPRPALFKQLAETLIPGLFEWHDWTDKVVDVLCRRRWSAFTGASNCVSAETRILDPITGERPTIKELCDGNIAPTVMTLYGAARAGVPFVKGTAELLEIRLENGSRFVATAEHVVLSANGFVPVKSLCLGQALFAYDQFPPGSISECALSNRKQDAPCSQRTVEGFQGGCRSSLRCDDELLLSARAVARSSFPSPNDVQAHIRCGRSDVPENRPSRIHGSSFSLHSIGRPVLRGELLEIPLPLRSYVETSLHDARWFRSCERFHSGTHLLSPLIAPTLGCEHRQMAAPLMPLPQTQGIEPPPLCLQRTLRPTVSRFPFSPVIEFGPGIDCRDSEYESTDCFQHSNASTLKVSHSKIVSIRSTGIHQFYDISVPGVEHYFAEGSIHHNSAKTFNVVNFACAWWMAAPEESSVILCSTTMKMLKKRAFAEVQRFYFEMMRATGGSYGTFVPSQTLWRSALNDDKHGIFGLAVAEGNTEKVADNIKGIHTKRQMVVIDEATAVPAAIWDATTNLYGYPIDSGGEFVLVALGNARSRLDQFGRFIEPEEGWDSVSIETDEWETKPRAEDGKRVLVTRFDFRRSPNVLADKRISKHLPTKQRVESRMASLKARGAENDPTHYSNDLGFPPPEGLTKTVFTESLIQMHDGYGRHRFTGVRFRIIGAYDQARTGDRPTLRFAAIGEIEGGGMGIEWMAPIIFYPDASAKDPIAYQYLKLLRNHCARVDYRDQQYVCEPKHLGIDCSNEATFGDLCQREWNYDIIRIQFGGAASEDAISHEDQRPANQVFRNKRAEMYFRTQYALNANQLKGIDKDTAAELTSIEYVDVRPDGTSKLITMMDKKEYRLKFGSSPDLADSGVMLSEVARLFGFRVIATGNTVDRTKEFEDQAAKAHAVYEDVSYSSDNEESDEQDYDDEVEGIYD